MITEEFEELLDMVENMEEADPDDPDNQGAYSDVMYELIDEVTLGMCFETHRACKSGTLFLDETDLESEKSYAIVDKEGRDVFGQVPAKKQMECVCPNCQRNLAASRFAPHLEKCMGMGRTSSRVASRRIANAGKKDSDNESEDNEQDHDWSYHIDKKSKKFKKDKSCGSPRRGKNATKVKSSASLSLSQTSTISSSQGSGDIPSVGSNTSEGSGSGNAPLYESFSSEERKTILSQQCGVISEHTKKMCTRSRRCPQHSEEQRKAVRLFLLGQTVGSQIDDDVHIDIDSYDDADTQSLRDSLHWEAVSNPSPADSTSTTTSTGSRKQKKRSSKSSKKSQSKNSKTSVNTEESQSSNLYDFP